MGEPGLLYRGIRERLTALLEPLDDEAAALVVPACPAWSVSDVVAHLAGVCADVVAGNIEGVGTDDWTEAQVAARRGRSLSELLAEWTHVAPAVEDLAPRLPGRTAAQLVTDAATHEHDVRGALGRPGARDSEPVLIGTDLLVTVGLAAAIRDRGLSPLRIRTPARTWIAGSPRPSGTSSPRVDDAAGMFTAILTADPEPANEAAERDASVTVELSTFELFRALTGRRSREQLAAYPWDADPTPYLDAFRFGPFRSSPTPIVE